MEASAELKVFNQLFTKYQSRFISFATGYVRDVAVAEDFTLEAMMYYWENRHTLALDTNPPAYILTTIKHKCLNYLHHLQTRKEVAERLLDHAAWELSTRIASLQACEPNELFTDEVQAIVNKTLANLPKQTRDIFVMNRYRNLSQKEIAAKLGITTKGVEFHMAKAIKVLRVELKDYIPAFLCLVYF